MGTPNITCTPVDNADPVENPKMLDIGLYEGPLTPTTATPASTASENDSDTAPAESDTPAESSASELPAVETPCAEEDVAQCSCGNEFMLDALYCRQCGQKRMDC